MSDEAHFRTSGCVNKQNLRYWCRGNARIPSSFRLGEPFGAGIFFKILAYTVFKMEILQEPKKVALRNKRHLEGGKNGECAACLKYSVSIFVE